MIPESISYDGRSVAVRFPENPKGISHWWDAAVEQQFEHHPELSSVESILTYEAMRRRLNRDQTSQLISKSKPKQCAKGTLIYLSPTFMRRIEGRVRTGGKSPIFLLSPRGRKGTLEVGTNSYHRYNESRFEVGTSRDWRFLPQVDADWAQIDTIQLPLSEG